MKIEVRLFASLREHLKGSENPLRIVLHEDATVDDLLKTVGIPVEKTKVIFVNGRQEQVGRPLREGDRVGIFPPSGGG
jgi:molybdopterin converting factor small subunit